MMARRAERNMKPMKNKAWWLISAMALGVAGCIPSLNPLYTEKDLVFDSALVGSWSEKDDADTWKFERGDNKSYKLTISDGGKSSPFIAHLVQLGQHRFLDLLPAKNGLDDFKGADFYKIGLIRGHLIFKVNQIEPALRLSFLDPEWFKKLLEANPQAIAHQKTSDDDGGLITASTAELQKFILDHVKTEGAWSDASDLKRREPAK
jgi:hypothetical protein